MADNKDSGKKYFRSTIAGLAVAVGAPKVAGADHEQVRFTPYNYITDMGEVLRFGYLETDNKRAIEVLANDPNVTEIDQENFEKYTDTKNEKVSRAAL